MDELTRILHDHWAMAVETIEPIAMRENQIFRVKSNIGEFALKIARSGYHPPAVLKSEITFLHYLASKGFAVAAPVATSRGTLLVDTDEGFASLQQWINGDTLGETGKLMHHANTPVIFREIGMKMAHLHKLATHWPSPPEFTRPSWGREGLVGETPCWGRFWENPILSDAEQREMMAFRDYARVALPPDEEQIIHADLVKENILLTPQGVVFIDFDDFGTGYSLFDLATVLLKNDREPDFALLKSELCAGYNDIRQFDFSTLDLFLALRAASYLGWIMSRPELDRDGNRAARYRDHAFKYIRKLKETI